MLPKNNASREDLFYKHFKRKEIVCSHIYTYLNADNKNKKMSAYPLCVQMVDDGYQLFWYCEKCIDKYYLSYKGTYVFDAGSSAECAGWFFPSEDRDENPYSEFLREQTSFNVDAELLDKYTTAKAISDPLESYIEIFKIPFGAKPSLDKD